MRIAEKKPKSRDLVILKHTSGTVEGWELEAADRQASTAPEIVLHSLPKVIFVRIDGAMGRSGGRRRRRGHPVRSPLARAVCQLKRLARAQVLAKQSFSY